MGLYGDEQNWAVASSRCLRTTRVGPEPIPLGHNGLLWGNILSCAIVLLLFIKLLSHN
jgi:hypothetical protein